MQIIVLDDFTLKTAAFSQRLQTLWRHFFLLWSKPIKFRTEEGEWSFGQAEWRYSQGLVKNSDSGWMFFVIYYNTNDSFNIFWAFSWRDCTANELELWCSLREWLRTEIYYFPPGSTPSDVSGEAAIIRWKFRREFQSGLWSRYEKPSTLTPTIFFIPRLRLICVSLHYFCYSNNGTALFIPLQILLLLKMGASTEYSRQSNARTLVINLVNSFILYVQKSVFASARRF